MNKVYIIRYEEYDDGNGYFSGISYVFKDLEKAKDMLKTIKEDELSNIDLNKDDIEVYEDMWKVLIEYGCHYYVEYVIEEREVI